MRIAFYLASFPVLSETFIHRQIASMIERGHDVTVIAARRAPQGPVHETVSEHRMLDRTVFLDGQGKGAAKALMGAIDWPLMDPAGFLAALARGISSRSPKALAKDMRNWAALRGRRFDAVIAHFGPAALQALGLIEAGLIGGPLYPIFHGYDITRYVRDNGDGVYAPLFRKAALCLAISDRWAARLRHLGCPADKVAVLRVGLPVEEIEFAPRRKAAKPLRLLSVARLVEKKGIEYAIRAVRQASSAVPVSYSIVGDGPLRGSLGRLVDSLGANGSVEFLGPLPEQQVKSLMRESDALLVPSVVASDGDEEGIPVVIMEAMASGLPVIASAHSGIPELVRDGLTGTLVPERDIASLADAIVRLAGHGPDGAILEEARKTVEEMHSSARLSFELERLTASTREGRD